MSNLCAYTISLSRERILDESHRLIYKQAVMVQIYGLV